MSAFGGKADIAFLHRILSAYDPKRTLGTSRLALVWPLEGWISKHSARL